MPHGSSIRYEKQTGMLINNIDFSESESSSKGRAIDLKDCAGEIIGREVVANESFADECGFQFSGPSSAVTRCRFIDNRTNSWGNGGVSGIFMSHATAKL
jgi:hypothetical protein